MRTERLVAIFGFLAGLLAAAMAVCAFSTGATQESFEAIRAAHNYRDALLYHATALRVAFTLDNLFLLSYSSFFLWFVVERRGKADPTACLVLIGALLFAALLDAAENFHILAMLARAENGQLPSDGQITLQYVLSAVKFTAGYFVAIIFGILYPRDTILARIVGISTAIGFPILGVLVFTTPPLWSDVFGLGRFVFFVLGFFVSGIVYWNRPSETVSLRG